MLFRPLLSLALVLLAIPASAEESLLDAVLKRDKLIVATYSTSPPLAYVDDSGNLVGFEIDMAREIAKDLLGDPNKVEFVVVQSDGRFPAALSGKVDFGLCSTTITPDRAVRIAFTRPYLDTGGSVIARRDAEIKHVKELNDPKFTYALLNVPPGIARVKSELPNVKQLLLDSPSALFLAVKTGRATAFGIDKPIADYYLGHRGPGPCRLAQGVFERVPAQGRAFQTLREPLHAPKHTQVAQGRTGLIRPGKKADELALE
jgi:polar amino acid transport system substrate-binding protein